MVQVLPPVPTFGSRLANVLSEAGGHIGEGLRQRGINQVLQQIAQGVPLQGDTANQGAPQQDGTQVQPAQQFRPLNPMELVHLAGSENEQIRNSANAALNMQLAERKIQARREDKHEQHKAETAQKAKEGYASTLSALDKQLFDLQQGKRALGTGDAATWKNWFAERLGPAGDFFKSSSGIALQASAKNLLVDTITKTGGRPNQWLEQQIQSATASPGKSAWANETIIDTAIAKASIEKALTERTQALSQAYEDAGMAPPSNIETIAREQVQPYAREIEDQLSYDLRVIYEKEQGERFLNNLKEVPQGTPLTIEKRNALITKFNGDKKKAMQVAKKLGYSIPSASVRNKLAPQSQPEQIPNG